MSYTVPTFEQMRAFLVAMWRSMFPESNVGSPFSYHWKRSNFVAAVATDGHANVASAQREVMPSTARGARLTEWGSIVGVSKQGATPARKSKALQITGTVGSAVAVGDSLTHEASGLRYQVNQAFVLVGPTGIVDIEAIDTGSQTRLQAGETLNFDTPPAGIDTIATLILDLDEDGFDAEQEPAYSRRVVAKLGEPQAGGNQSDYVAWAKQVTGVAQAFCYPHRAGIGTVDVAALHIGSGDARALNSGENSDLLAYLQSKAPTQVTNALRTLMVQTDAQPVEITVTPSGDPQWDFDWDDSTPLVVLSWTGATRTLQFTTSRPPTMQAGDRLTLKGIASSQDGRQFKIESLPGAADSVVLEVAPTNAPAATDIAYSGGPLVDMIRDAICGHIDGEIIYCSSDGPIRASQAGSIVRLIELAQGMGTANPGGIYGDWSGSLIVAELQKIAAYPRGARNAHVLVPATDYDAIDYAFPNDDKIGLIKWSSVIVRRG